MLLRPYQTSAIDSARRLLQLGKRRILLCAPTGAGKTVIATEGLIRPALIRGRRVLFIAHRAELLQQCADKLRHTDELPLPISLIKAGFRTDYDCPLQVASIQTLVRRELPFADLVIWDEAHHATANSYQRVQAAYPQAVHIGLTATPYRSGGKGLGGCFDSLVEVATIPELIRDGFLVKPRCFALPGPDLSGVRTVAGDYHEGQLAEVMDKPRIGTRLVETYQRHAAGRSAIAFAVNVEHSKHIVEQFVQAGIAAEHLDGGTDPELRAAILERLASGATAVVSNCGVLTEGFDCPRVACVILARPTKSRSLWRQCVGRGLRPFPGKADCIAEGQMVLTDRGLVAIENVSINMKIWDGCDFVNHQGAYCRGEQTVIRYAGITGTPDHKVWTNQGWETLEKCAAQQIPIAVTGHGRTPIRETDRCFRVSNENEIKGCARGEVLHMRRKVTSPLFQSYERNGGLSPVRKSQVTNSMAGKKVQHHQEQMRKSEITRVSEIRWEGDRIPVFIAAGDGDLLSRDAWVQTERSDGDGSGSDQQRGPLRGREYPNIDSITEPVPHPQADDQRGASSIQDDASGNKIRRFNTVAFNSPGNVGQTDHREIPHAIKQTKRRVWDILAAGPLHRFTVEGLLVHNCQIHDHAGARSIHGEIDDAEELTLDGVRPKPGSAAQPVRQCMTCFAIVATTHEVCPECGAAFPKPKPVERETVDEELSEATERAVPRDGQPLTPVERRAFFALVNTAAQRSWKAGAVSYRFKERYGRWPASREVVEKAVADRRADLDRAEALIRHAQAENRTATLAELETLYAT